MVTRLCEDWRLGREAVEAEESPARVSTATFAVSRGLSEHTARKLKAFARSYNQDELNALCALRRPNGLPLHWGYVIYLLAVQAMAQEQGADDKAAREEFARQATEKGWTAPQLHSEIRRKYGREPGHGRAMVLADDLEAAMRQVINQSRAWCRRLEMLLDKMSGRKKIPREAAREL